MYAHVLGNLGSRKSPLAVIMILGVLVTLALPGSASAQDCEIPLFVKQSLHGANVMLVADNSGSMNDAVYHLEYDAYTNYSGGFTNGATYFVSKAGKRKASDFGIWSWSTVEAYFVASDNGEDGRYSGNYLNWIYYHATADQRDNIPQVTRIQVLKEVLCGVIDRGSQQLNFGLTIFQNDHAGNIVAKCGTNPVSVKATINGITANAWTPLGETMETLVDYWSYDGPDAAIQSHCQYNFNVVVTDGMPTMDTEVSTYLWDHDHDGADPGNCTSIGSGLADYYNCSDHMDDIAHYMAYEDLRPDLEEDQHVFTYVVGFHEKGELLQDTAANGDGLFFYSHNAYELSASIDYAIQDIMRRISSGSAVAVVSTEQGTDDRLYRGKFMPLDWDGYLECYALPIEDGDAAIWEAGALLSSRSPSDRDIFTALGDVEYKFAGGNASELAAAMGIADLAEAADLIEWGRGENVEGLRYRREWRLGDIVHSTPVVVGAPSNFFATPAYQTFYNDNKGRQRLVYVGANDGMLHAFDAEYGYEAWAFVPQFALPDFAAMADSGYCHTYTCDQTVTVKDIQIGGIWRTILLGGGSQGGHEVFCLDITEPLDPEVMWQTSLPNACDFASMVEAVNIGGREVALVGSGLDEALGEAWIYAIDLETGAVVSDYMLSDVKVRNRATEPAVVDYDLDGEVDLVYIGDLAGNMWRMKTNGTANMSSWSVTQFYTGYEPITAPPAAAFGPNGAVYVYFGTGAYLTEDDMMTADPQYFICLFDKNDGAENDLKDLANQTSSIGDVTSDDGWYVELVQKEGERIKGKAAVIAENVIFTSFAPTLEACAAGGESWLYKMAYDDGGLLEDEKQEDPEDRVESLGQGIASHPVVDLAGEQVVIQSSDASITTSDIATPIRPLEVRAWQESFVTPPAEAAATQPDIN